VIDNKNGEMQQQNNNQLSAVVKAITAAIDTQQPCKLLLTQDECSENHGGNNIDGAVQARTSQLLHW